MNINLEKIISEIQDAKSIHELLYVLKPKFLGKESQVMLAFQEMRNLSNEERKSHGKFLNEIKVKIENTIDSMRSKIEETEIEKNNLTNEIDITIPASHDIGSMHPISFAIEEITEIFARMGFDFKEGPEIEDDYHNFTALNVPMFHPARQMQDTFYLQDHENILRTHTTSVDIRAGKFLKPPFKIMSAGKTYRNESDKTHSPMFHQFEGLYVDKNLSMADLKSYISFFLQEFFEIEDVNLNFRPSYFPFTTPSAEVDIYYHHDSAGKIVFGSGNKTLEILGCGMLHSNVLREMNINPDEFSAIAFGGGIERLAMLKYGMNDIRHFYNGNLEWINHYKFR